MAQIGANMAAFYLGKKNCLPPPTSNTILLAPINRAPSIRDPPMDVAPLTAKKPMGKDKHKNKKVKP